MHRNTLSEINSRIMHLAARVTLNKANDDPMVQELFADMMNSDARQKIERIQAFGFSSMPLPRDEQKQQQGGQQSGGQQSDAQGEQPKGPAAEGICLFIGGQRNHPVCIAIDDRRHRPMGLKPGENAQYDDQGQMTILRRAGAFILSLDDEKDSGNGGASTRAADGGQQQNKERMVSLRHVMKKKQQRKGMSGQQGGASGSGGGASAGTFADTGGASGGQGKEDYKHEGETVNTEVRATKQKIEIFDKDQVVAVYDRQAGQWTFNCKKMVINASDTIKIEAKNKFDLIGHPLVFNNGTPTAEPFQIP